MPLLHHLGQVVGHQQKSLHLEQESPVVSVFTIITASHLHCPLHYSKFPVYSVVEHLSWFK